MTDPKALSFKELQELAKWLQDNEDKIPSSIYQPLSRMISIYSSFSKGASKARQTLTRLREAMGIAPRSERGKSIQSSQGQPELPIEALTPEQQKEYQELKKRRDEYAKGKSEYDRKLRAIRPQSKADEQLEFDFELADEVMFADPVSNRSNRSQKQKVNRMSEFNKEKGLHSTYDTVKRVNLEIVVTDITYDVETVTDPITGKSVRASMSDEGPENFQVTWKAVANLLKMHVGFAIPINRISLMIGQPEFSSSKICRILEYVATKIHPIYIHLFESLSDVAILTGDDTSTKVLEVNTPSPEQKEGSLAYKVEELLGWISPRSDGKGEKKALNVSLLMGRSNKKDPRSTIRFYRTHIGSVGNLLTKALESRQPKSGPIIFQGDLSTTNLPAAELRERFSFKMAGCGAHARRPFWRYKEDDEVTCYYMLRGFLLLSQIEDLIDARGRTEKNVMKYRGRYSRKVWEAISNRCLAVTTGSTPGQYTYRQGSVVRNVWPPGSEIYSASRYILNHFEELTLYLTNPHLQYTNNHSERALRIEKCMLSGSKFRKTINGRVVLDILRTINSTCTAAQVDVTDYLRYVFKHLDKLEEAAEKLTPFNVSLELKKNTQK